MRALTPRVGPLRPLALRAARRGIVGAAVAGSALAAAAQAPLPRDVSEPVVARQALQSFAPALSRGMAITVGIYTVGSTPGHDPAGRSDAREGRGSDDDLLHGKLGAGFIVGEAGLIVTAAHVVAGSGRIVVKLPDRRVLRADLIGADEDADIALIRVPLALPAPPVLGRSTSLRLGDWVLAVGEPYGFNRSVSAGIVGGKDRHVAEEPELLFIQTDLALNPGNSGGPLLDSAGSVVGMNTRSFVGGFGAPGVSFAVPIEIVMQIVGELQGPERIVRPRLGAEFQDVSPPAAFVAGHSHANGALVGSVASDSVAAQLGLEPGDIVVGMNGRPIGDSADLVHALLAWRTAVGTRLTVMRAGRYRELGLP